MNREVAAVVVVPVVVGVEVDDTADNLGRRHDCSYSLGGFAEPVDNCIDTAAVAGVDVSDDVVVGDY